MALRKRTLGIGAVAAGAVLVAGALALQATNSDSDPAPASSDGATQTSTPPGGDCTMKVNSVLFSLDPGVAAQFAAGGLEFSTIAPATTVATGLEIAPKIHAARDVSCDFAEGYIGMRGGFSVENARGKVDFRRFRLKIDEREMLAFLKSTGASGLEAIDVNVDEAQFTERGSLVSAVAPMVLDSGAAVAMNATLGTDFPADVIELGTVTIAGERSDGGSSDDAT